MNYEILFIVGIFFLVFIFNKYFSAGIRSNLQVAALILNANIEKKYFGLTEVAKGYYREREISFIINPWSKHSKVHVKVIPRHVPREQKTFMFMYPKPTRETLLMKNEIWYDLTSTRDWSGCGGLRRRLEDGEMREFF